jgi:protoheme IX farnesyltransferase
VSSRLTDFDQPASAKPHSTMPTWRAYLALTKPRIIELLLVTTIPTMFLAASGFPSWTLVFATLLGGTLAAGGANVLNCYLDRDIDALMERTAHRPSATGQISGSKILIFGFTLSLISVTSLALTVNALSSILAFVAIAFYVIGYTMLLKRRTSQNIVWGGAAGCMPVLIGWSAVTGSLSWTPVILFMIVFLWTPPHYWPLSLRYKDDYAAAGIPMLPVEQSLAVVARQIILYSWAMVGVTLVLIPVAGMTLVYSIIATVCGGIFLFEAYALQSRVRKELTDLKPMKLFHWSITYLSLIFLAIGIDPFFN